MQTNNKIKSVWKKLRFSYKLTIFNEHTLEQVVMLRISRLTVILSILIAVILIGGLTTYLITRTPLRRTLPGYISPEMRRQIVDNAISVDSLSRIVNINKAYLDNLSNIISGNIPLDSTSIMNNFCTLIPLIPFYRPPMRQIHSCANMPKRGNIHSTFSTKT